MTAPATTPPAGARPRTGRLLEVEDLLLAGWVTLADYLARRSIWSPDRLLEEPGGRFPIAIWIIFVLCVFLLFTRGPEDTDREVALRRRIWMVGPLVSILGLYAMAAGELAGAWLKWRPKTASGEPAWPGPAVSRFWRRTAAVPVMILGDTLFRSEFTKADILHPLEYSGGPFLLVLGILAPYVLFVVGPRIVAGGALAWQPWAVRLVFLVVAEWVAAPARA
ncbi:hypothetical protein [Luteitalea sp.]|jgi:hypothetical protein|uniref:hypothetical protein n=1 Tax=Luteitalea sp. TaxID=2004800 RepID=UPI0037CC085B